MSRFEAFEIQNYNKAHQREQVETILINLDQLVSLKPINMVNANQEVVNAYWIRLTNGKKYKAVNIPIILKDKLEEKSFIGQSEDDSSLPDQLQ